MQIATAWGRAVSSAASLAWHGLQTINRAIPDKPFHPRWAPAPMLKQQERTFPQLGFPRETDSLCPKCVIEVRDRIVAGQADWQMLVNEKPGEIRARIVERDNQVFMEKTCPTHGTWSDLMAMDAEFLRRIERLYPGRDFRIAPDALHDHGTSSIKYGRGAVLTIDLTNRCNMMCDPCFMDANQVGYVHELSFDDVRETSRRRDHGEAATAVDRAVLGGRTHPLAAFPRGDRVCANGRLFLGAVRDQRRPVRAGPRIRAKGTQGRPAPRLPAVRRHRQRQEHPPCGQQPVRREVEGDRAPARCGDRRHPGGNGGEFDQQRSDRRDHPLRDREHRQDQRGVVPAGLLHGA